MVVGEDSSKPRNELPGSCPRCFPLQQVEAHARIGHSSNTSFPATHASFVSTSGSRGLQHAAVRYKEIGHSKSCTSPARLDLRWPCGLGGSTISEGPIRDLSLPVSGSYQGSDALDWQCNLAARFVSAVCRCKSVSCSILVSHALAAVNQFLKSVIPTGPVFVYDCLKSVIDSVKFSRQSANWVVK